MSKKGTIPIIIGLLLIAAALFLIAYNVWDGIRAGSEAGEAVAALKDDMPETFRIGDVYQVREYAESEPEPVPEMAVAEENGYDYIGIIHLPFHDLALPVMADWDYDRLQKAPCVYTGSYYTNNLVICGHNFLTHFASLRWIELGEEIYLTTVDGLVYRYIVDNIETVQPTEIDRMIDGDDWDLTLFTCYPGGTTRCAVRCVLAEE